MPGVDLRLYIETEQYTDRDQAVEWVRSAGLSKPPATNLEVIGNKVVKFLKTTHGSDGLEPNYGGRAFSIPQMSKDHLPKFRLEVENDIERCIAYIKGSESNLPNSVEKLSRILLQDIIYNPDIDPTRIDVKLELVTNRRHKVLVTVTRNIG